MKLRTFIRVADAIVKAAEVVAAIIEEKEEKTDATRQSEPVPLVGPTPTDDTGGRGAAR
jgi:hypothetical protein